MLKRQLHAVHAKFRKKKKKKKSAGQTVRKYEHLRESKSFSRETGPAGNSCKRKKSGGRRKKVISVIDGKRMNG